MEHTNMMKKTTFEAAHVGKLRSKRTKERTNWNGFKFLLNNLLIYEYYAWPLRC